MSAAARRPAFRLRISHRITLCFLLALILPLALSIFLVARDLNRRAVEETERQAGFALRITTNFLGRLRDAPLVRLRNLVEEGGLRQALAGDSAALAAFLEARRADAGYAALALLDGAGTPLALAGEAEGFENDPVRAAHDGEMLACIRLDGAVPVLHAAVPVSGSGAPAGSALYARLLLPPDTLDPVKNITEMEVALHPPSADRAALTTRVGGDARRVREGLVPTAVRTALLRAPQAMSDEEFLGRRYLVAWGTILPGDARAGYISVAMPRELVSRTSTMIVRTLYGVGLFSILLAIAAGSLLSLSIARPLRQFARLADRISEGGYDERIALRRSDEIGDLALTFNTMAGKLQATMARLERRMFEISTLHAVAQSMNFMNNTEQLLAMILDRSVKALDAARGSLMLVHPDTFDLEVSVVSGFDGPVEKRIRLRPGDGVAGIALETGRTQLVSDVAADPRFRSFRETEDAERHLRCMLCVPLKIGDRVSGVLNIINKRDPRGFTEDDVRLLEALASQAAVTIENAKLYELSITDGMTKLFIHRYFQVRLDEELRRAERYGGEVSLVMTDVDHFKKFNDDYGHQTGDQVLVRVAQIMRDAVRKEVDIPCRYGGEEFAIIAPNTGRDEALVMAERLRSMVEETDLPGPEGRTLRITISLGIATFPADSAEKMELIRLADRALYHSKESGRNRSTHAGDLSGKNGGTGNGEG